MREQSKFLNVFIPKGVLSRAPREVLEISQARCSFILGRFAQEVIPFACLQFPGTQAYCRYSLISLVHGKVAIIMRHFTAIKTSPVILSRQAIGKGLLSRLP